MAPMLFRGMHGERMKDVHVAGLSSGVHDGPLGAGIVDHATHFGDVDGVGSEH